ncbi:GNAT family N-acetyltransferase [Aquibacillus kalidii]|uniref:GNAT family N-acetyltransferase n=1 Tax=Aquibacillus kalidii TaxID=2762597 RepID=UPI0016448A5C|nr:GNAT family N-acetyltransferase [Aquibacillus kalidii]
MSELYFIKDYKENAQLRESFNELATLTFGINFENWYQKGYWNNRYIPFSYVKGGMVVANVSVNLIDFIIDGETKTAIQIGTVMTHPTYRNQGLSSKLMNRVLEKYEKTCDFVYLFANQNVLDFYPKFGFQPVNEYQFFMEYSMNKSETTSIRQLDVTNKNDLNFIFQMAADRLPVSSSFSTENTQGLLMFYCLYVFNDHIYYIEEEEAIVIFTQKGTTLNIFDVVSKKYVRVDIVLSKISNGNTEKVVFHYTPDYEGLPTQSEIHNGDDILFVKELGSYHFPDKIKHPIMAQA